MTDFHDRVERALAEHDTMLALCPVNNPPRGKAFGRFDACPRCHATANGTCGLSSGAGHRLAEAIRGAIAAAQDERRAA